MRKALTDGVHKNLIQGVYYYVLNSKKDKQNYATKAEAGKAYVAAYLVKNPKMKELFEGKSWLQIFRMMKIEL